MGRTRISRWLTEPWYPIVFVAAYVINVWRAADVPLDTLWRPLLVVVGGAGILVGLSLVALGRRRRAGGVATLILLALLTREPAFVAELSARFDGQVAVIWNLLILAALALAAWIGWQAWRRPGMPARLTQGANTLGTTLLVVVIASAWTDGSISVAFRELDARETVPGDGDDGASELALPPDIYIVMLDGYPRADTLADLYELDNAPFVDGLADRGFAVAPASGTNYMFTQQTLMSMLNFTHVPELQQDLERDTAKIGDAMRLALAENRAFPLLKDLGYTTVTVSGGYDTVGLNSADRVVDTGQLSELERHLIRRTAIIDLLELAAPEWLPHLLRERVRAGLRAIPEVARDAGARPRFVLAHIPSPHPPNLFKRDGSPQDVRDLRTFHADSPQATGLSPTEFAAQVHEQILYLNELVLDTADALLDATAGEAVIVVMSDHGPRMTVTIGDPDDPNLSERYGTLFAAYTPGRTDLFGARPTNINLLPILLNAYAGTDLPCLPDHAYVNGPGGYLDLERVPQYDGASPAACGR